MVSEVATFVLSIIATIFGICVLVSTVPRSWQSEVNHEPDPMNPFVYVMQFVCYWLWLSYTLYYRDAQYPDSVLPGNIPLAVLSVIGIIVGLGSYFVYLANAPKTDPLRRPSLIVFVALWAVVAGFWTGAVAGGLDSAIYAQVIGWMANVAEIVFFFSPLLSIVTVIRAKNSAPLSWPFSICQFITTALWVVYGALTKQFVLFVPNVAGACFGIAQVVLLAIYRGDSERLRVWEEADAAHKAEKRAAKEQARAAQTQQTTEAGPSQQP